MKTISIKTSTQAEILDAVNLQEKNLRFEHFTNEDAWELGKHLVEKVKTDGIEMAVNIRKVNGNTIFSYFSEGTNKMNENWMNRKFNTVLMNESSSFKQWALNMEKNYSVESMGMDQKEYVLCGGGFPIKLTNGEMVAVVLASNLPHEQDHMFLVNGIASFLGIEEVPQINA